MSRFDRVAEAVAHFFARSTAFGGAIVLILVWAVAGPPMRFADNWHLLINTPTTIITFLGVFLIQNQQWRDSKAVHTKLDSILERLAEIEETSEEGAKAAEGVEEEIGTG